MTTSSGSLFVDLIQMFLGQRPPEDVDPRVIRLHHLTAILTGLEDNKFVETQAGWSIIQHPTLGTLFWKMWRWKRQTCLTLWVMSRMTGKKHVLILDGKPKTRNLRLRLPQVKWGDVDQTLWEARFLRRN